jgi:hypothetical protein
MLYICNGKTALLINFFKETAKYVNVVAQTR